MKKVEKPRVVIDSERKFAERFCEQKLAELQDNAQDYMEYYGMLESAGKVFDPTEKIASYVVLGAISYASRVFGNRLVYGRGNYRKEDKMEIIEHLRKVLEILNK